MDGMVEFEIKKDVEIQLSSKHKGLAEYFTVKQEFDDTSPKSSHSVTNQTFCGDVIQCVLNKESIKHFYDENNSYIESEINACIIRNLNTDSYYKVDGQNYTCSITVSELKFLKTFNYLNSGRKLYTCCLCNYNSRNINNLKTHKKNHCYSSKPCKCKSKRITLKDLKDRKEKRQRKEINVNSTFILDANQHNESYTNFSCLMCNYKCHNLSDLREHTLVHTKCSYIDDKDCSCFKKTQETKYSDKSIISCIKCSFTSLDCSEFQKHELTHADNITKSNQNSIIGNKYYNNFFDFGIGFESHANQPLNEPQKQHSCNECSFTCEQKSLLIKHKQKHAMKVIPKKECQLVTFTTDGNRYNCNLCDKSFKSQPILKRHQRLSHTDVKLLSCDTCDFTTKHIWIYEKHMFTNHNRDEFKNVKLYSCEKCDYKARYPYILKKHRLLHGYTDNHFLCKNCGKSCIDKNELIQHSQDAHPDDENILLEIVKFEANFKDHDTSDDPESFRFRCNFCSYKTSRRYLMKNHTLKLHNRDEYSRKHNDKKLTCEICDYTAVIPSIMKRHQQRHSEDRPYICEKCGAQFKFHDILQKHMQSHVLDKPYVCDVCGRAFRSTLHLKLHSAIHSDQTPFACNMCDHQCKTKYYLRLHKLKKHDPAAWNVYQQNRKKKRLPRPKFNSFKLLPCDKCPYSTKSLGDLRTHRRIHSDEKPFSCDVCSYRSRFSSNLIKHKQSHLMGKPFTCNICSKNLKSQTYLDRHMMLHTGVRPFICESCPKGFIRRDRLVRHIKDMHKNKIS